MTTVLLFIGGAILGSFINVVTRRYDGTASVWSILRLGGRARCESCGATLGVCELIPIVSFILQRGRCKRCRAKLSWQYPLVEIVSGLIVAGFPLSFGNYFMISQRALLGTSLAWFWYTMVIWICAALALLTLALIDVRLKIIPDELTILIAILGIAAIAGGGAFHTFGQVEGSFFETYASIFGMRQNIVLNYGFAALAGLLIFGVIFFVTRGKGIGLGDVKLAGALGLLFGWPDALLLFVFASFVGALAGLLLLIFRHGTMKDTIPFGPFLALGAFLVWFYGNSFVSWYFGLFV